MSNLEQIKELLYNGQRSAISTKDFESIIEQLELKNQECEELKKQCDEHRSNAESYCRSYQNSCIVNGEMTDRALRYKQALDDIEGLAKKFCKDCGDSKDCNDGKEGCYYSLIPDLFNIISKAKENKNAR